MWGSLLRLLVWFIVRGWDGLWWFQSSGLVVMVAQPGRASVGWSGTATPAFQ